MDLNKFEFKHVCIPMQFHFQSVLCHAFLIIFLVYNQINIFLNVGMNFLICFSGDQSGHDLYSKSETVFCCLWLYIIRAMLTSLFVWVHL